MLTVTLGLESSGKQQDVQAVGERILGDALHRGDLLDARRQGLREGRDSQQENGGGGDSSDITTHEAPFERIARIIAGDET